MLSRRQRFQLLTIPTALGVLFLLYEAIQNRRHLLDTLSYSTRPLWDSADGPQLILPHYYAEGMEIDTHACQLHGWPARADKRSIKVIDAILISSELDLLEIRLNELESVVDRFFILESNATFTGIPKPQHFLQNRERFSKWRNKIEYFFLPSYTSGSHSGLTAWQRESRTRDAMTRSIRSHILEFKPGTQPLVIMSDLDEIPSWHTIELLKTCDFGPEPIHLQMRTYLYSFEWYMGLTSWRASVTLWPSTSSSSAIYRHSKSSDVALADSGWHCSSCFRTLDEYVDKMLGYSHADRLDGRKKEALLDKKRIQDVICTGNDIFGMLPEAYSYGSLLSQINPEPLKSAIGIPWYALANPDYFKFLLPNGCIRESSSNTTATIGT